MVVVATVVLRWVGVEVWNKEDQNEDEVMRYGPLRRWRDETMFNKYEGTVLERCFYLLPANEVQHGQTLLESNMSDADDLSRPNRVELW